MADRSVLVRLRADASQFRRELATAGSATSALVANLEAADGRMANLVQTGMMLAPALIPIGGLATTAVVGLANQLTFAAAGAGVAVLAFQGMGDALGALNDYRLEPTSANMLKVEQAMAQLSPAGREFASFVNGELRPAFDRLKDTASEGLFPGMQDGLESMRVLAPQVEGIVSTLATTTGDLMREAGDNLADPRWQSFFDWLDAEARPTLVAMGRTTGNFAETLANLWMAFDPVSDDFSQGFLEMSRSLADWSRGLSSDADFQGFISYLRETGPQAAETLLAIARALAVMVEAAAPVGRALLPLIEGLADGLANVASSPVGPILIGAAAGIGAIGRSLALLRAAGLRGDQGGLGGLLFGGSVQQIRSGTAALLAVPSAQDRATKSVHQFAEAEQARGAAIRAGARETAKLAGQGVAFAALATGIADSAGLANTATMALVGSFAGPWGAALGAATGLTMDAAAANDDLTTSLQSADRAASSWDMTSMQTALRQSSEQLDTFREKVEDPSLFTFDLSKGAARTKNLWEGIFGSSDVEEATRDMDDVRAKYARMVDTMREAPARADMQARGLAETRHELDAATESAEDFAAALAKVSEFLQGRSDMRDYQAALDGFTASLRENGHGFDIATEKGRNNQAALDDIAGTALSVADGLRGMSRVRFLEGAAKQIQDFGEKFNVPRAQTRGLIRELLRAAGINVDTWVRLRGAEDARSKIGALARQYGLTPAEVRTLIQQPNIGSAKAQVDQLRQKYDLTPKQVRTLVQLLGVPGVLGGIANVRSGLDGLDGKTARTYVVNTITTVRNVLNRVKNSVMGNADGSVVDYYAAGGTAESHVAQVAPAGAWRVWAEPETGGEAYIPLAASKRGRSLAIWEETGRRLGVDVARLTPAQTHASRVTVEGRVTGRVSTPWGDVPLEGTIRQLAREEIDADRDFDQWGRPR